MRKKCPFVNLNYFKEDSFSSVCHIGTDLLLVNQDDDFPEINLDIFKVDVCTCIFHEEGNSIIKINTRQYEVSAPGVLVILPGQVVEPIFQSDDLKYKVIVMSRRFCEDLFFSASESFQLMNVISEMPTIGNHDDFFIFEEYYQMLSKLVKAPDNEYKYKASQHLTMAMFFGYAYNYSKLKDNKESLNRKNLIFKELIILIEQNFKQERKLSFYANKLCVTPKYLSTITKEIAGVNALQIINGYVITEAKVLLRTTELSLLQISIRLNFLSQSDFGKYFKKSTGMSPKAYRKNDYPSSSTAM